MMFQLIIFISSFHALNSAECYNAGLWWPNDNLLNVYLRVHTAPLCLEICQKTPDCVAFSWLSGKFVEQYLAETCLTFNDTSTPESCEECISGMVADCQVCGQHEECQVENNLITTITTSTELECKETCQNTEGCEYYTWYDDSTSLKNSCFLLTFCGDTVECEGCSSGPPKCPRDYCEGLEYNLFDDHTRNEKYGKK